MSHATGQTQINADLLRTLYKKMVVARTLDLEGVAMQRQGITPGYAPMRGQEAAQIGSAAALQDGDFAFVTYRELGVAVARDTDLVGYMATHLASWHGGLYDSKVAGVGAINAVVAGGVLHAVGWAQGETLKGSKGVALSYFGDGASSQGDVHEAMNFAAIFDAPVVFFCQNNGWAISVPTEKQVAGGSVAARAAGYGMPGVRIDGNNIAAVYEATDEAVERARNGGGPSVIEAMTFRAGPHSTSDDPGRYRSLEEENEWKARGPLTVAEERLTAEGILTAADIERYAVEAKVETERVRQGVIELQDRPATELFDYVFADTPAALKQQRALWEANQHD